VWTQGRRSWRRSRTRRSRGFRAKRESFFPGGGAGGGTPPPPRFFFGFERARRRVYCTELRASSFCQVQRAAPRGHLFSEVDPLYQKNGAHISLYIGPSSSSPLPPAPPSSLPFPSPWLLPRTPQMPKRRVLAFGITPNTQPTNYNTLPAPHRPVLPPGSSMASCGKSPAARRNQNGPTTPPKRRPAAGTALGTQLVVTSMARGLLGSRALTRRSSPNETC
jgi:hypothetical protein